MRRRLVRLLRRSLLVTLVGSCVLATGTTAGAEPGVSGVVKLLAIAQSAASGPFTYSAISCPSAGNCAAAGPGPVNDSPAASGDLPSVVVESSGTWGSPVQVALPAGAATTSTAWPGITALSCPDPGDCVAVGGYPTTKGGAYAPLLETESSGVWASSAVVAPVGADAATGGAERAELYSVQCLSAGDCVAVGTETDTDGLQSLFADVESAGTWGAATKLPRVSPQTAHDQFPVAKVVCSDVSDCLVVSTDGADSYAWTQTAGTWSTPVAMPTGETRVFVADDLACPDPTTCLAVGAEVDPNGVLPTEPGFSVETSGIWSEPHMIAFPRLSPVASEGTFSAISCDTDATCEVTGLFLGTGGLFGAFFPSIVPGVATWSDGAFSSIGYVHLPTSPDDLLDIAEITGVTCPSVTQCVALGADVGLGLLGESGDSYAVALTPDEAVGTPPPPIEAAGSQLRGGIVASWQPPYSDGGSPITSFTAHVLPGGESCTTTGYSCQIHGLANGHRYVLVVADRTADGSSTQARAGHLVVAGLVPTRPSEVLASDKKDRLVVEWHRSVGIAGEPVQHYVVTVSGPKKFVERLSTKSTHCSFGWPRKAGLYKVSVVALDASGPSLPSHVAEVRVAAS